MIWGESRHSEDNSTETFNSSHFILLKIHGTELFIEYYNKSVTTLSKSTYIKRLIDLVF